MKVFFKFFVCVVVCVQTIVLTGCSYIEVRGKTFAFNTCSVNFMKDGKHNYNKLKEEINRMNDLCSEYSFTFFENGEVDLFKNLKTYYVQNGKNISLFLNAELTENYLGNNNTLELTVYENMVVLNYISYENSEHETYYYTVTFLEAVESN